MNRYIRKMLRRSIRSSLGRYLAILAIVALGVGFFAGLKSSMPAMLSTADDYLRAQRFQDFQLLSTLGFTPEDVRAFRELDAVEEAEGAWFVDAVAEADGVSGAWHFMSLTERVSVPYLTAGRLPEAPGECLGDERVFERGDIGRTVTISPDNDADTLDLLSRDSYTVVGLARSPRYISDDRGSTSLGAGSVEGFVILSPAGFSAEAYHEILLWCGLPGAIYSEEYSAARSRTEPEIKSLLNRRGALRRAGLWAQAEDELEEARVELDAGWIAYAEGRDESDRKLADALAELKDARAELDDGWDELEKNWKKLEDGMAEVRDGLDEIAENRRTLDGKSEEIEDGYAQIEAARAELAPAIARLDAAQAELDAGWAQLAEGERQTAEYRQMFEEANRELNEREQELRDQIAADDAARYLALEDYYAAELFSRGEVERIQNRIDALEDTEENAETLAALREQLARAQAAHDAAQAALAAAEESYVPDASSLIAADDVIAELHERAAGIEAQLTAAETELAATRTQLEAAQAELDAGRAPVAAAAAELDANEAQLKAGEEEIRKARGKLDAAEKKLKKIQDEYPGNLRKLEDARAELEDGEAELADGWQEYEDGKAEAAQKLRDAKQELLDGETELADARAELEDTLALEVYTLDRSTIAGYVTFENDTTIIDAIADAFPVFFALIAALVCVTTMTRMVNEERTVIGTMKAMGYSGGAIMSKYLAYAGSSALLGCVAGYFLGTRVIPYVVSLAYGIMYTTAALEYYFNPWMYAACMAAAVPGALFVTWLACRRELAEKPAELIRPKAPGSGRRVLLEYVTPLWDRLSFLSKVTLRNAFRHKVRVLMMLLGIGGCTALLVTGFGVLDSLSDLSKYQYEEIFLYDLAVTLEPEEFASDAAAESLWAGGAGRSAMCFQDPVTMSAGGLEKSTRVVAADGDALRELIDLHNKNGAVAWPDPGEAVITQKLADRLALRVGDPARLRLDDGTEAAVTVTGICDNYLSHYVYVDARTVGSPRNNTALLRAAEGADADRLAARLRAEDGVSYVTVTARERETMEQSMASLDIVVFMLIICSGILAFITLYNLTNINIMERTREIATVKVLGFYPGETASYILRENLLLSFLGAAAGMELGRQFHRFVMGLVDVESLTCEVRILPVSYLWSFLITLAFAAFTNWVMRFKLEKVDMAESLKSVE